ncbi:MAG: tetratricopeptide repeat protein [Phycisphaerae bacterium]
MFRPTPAFLIVFFLFLHVPDSVTRVIGEETNDLPMEANTTGTLLDEEAIGRFQQLLQRRPMHGTGFSQLVKHYTERGQLSQLVDSYESRVAALPDELSPRIILVRLYLRVGRSEEAAKLATTLDVAPDALGRDYTKWLVLQSEVLQQIGKLDESQRVLRTAQEAARTVAEKLELAEAQADLFLRADQPAEAVEVLRNQIAAFPEQYLHRQRIAEALATRNLHEAAAEEYDAILALVGNDAERRCETLSELGRCLERLSRTEKAIEHYKEAVDLLASDHWLRRELHERIVALYRKSGRMDDLVAFARQQVERAPEQTAPRLFLADVLVAAGLNEDARDTLTTAVTLFPKDRLLSERNIQLLERDEKHAEAATEYERIISQYPDDVELYVAYGQFLALNKKVDAARNQWKHVLQRDLDDAMLAERLGSMFEPYELYDDAAECYERSIAIDPSRSDPYAALARLWHFRGEREKALSTLRQLTERNPENPEAHAEFCRAARSLGFDEEALTAIERASALAPEQANYQLTHADLLIRAGRLDEALAVRRATIDRLASAAQRAQAISVLVSLYRSADALPKLLDAEEARLETKPDDATTLLLLARAADMARDFPQARKWLERLLAAHPDDEEARKQLARLYEAAGETDAAIAAYRMLIEQHPGRARQYFQAIADLKLRYNDRAGAIDVFEELVRANPDNATVQKEIAEQLLRIGEYEPALKHYGRSLELQPDRYEVRLAYGKALEANGRLDEALQQYRRAGLQTQDRETAAEAIVKLHEIAGAVGRLDEMFDELEATVEHDPQNTLVARALAELLIREFEYTRAMKLIENVLRHQPRDLEMRLVLGELLRRLTRFDAAADT